MGDPTGALGQWPWESFAALLVLITVQWFAVALRRLAPKDWPRIISAAGGLSVAYVFIDLLPELAASEAAFHRQRVVLFKGTDLHVYFFALLGLLVFYGFLGWAARRVKARGPADRSPHVVETMLFALYNGLLGYLLVHRTDAKLTLYTIAVAAHLLVTHYGLYRHHAEVYRGFGRKMLTGAMAVGWFLGLTTSIGPLAIARTFGLLAGGMILSVLRAEIPEEGANRFAAFIASALVYTFLLAHT